MLSQDFLVELRGIEPPTSAVHALSFEAVHPGNCRLREWTKGTTIGACICNQTFCRQLRSCETLSTLPSTAQSETPVPRKNRFETFGGERSRNRPNNVSTEGPTGLRAAKHQAAVKGLQSPRAGRPSIFGREQNASPLRFLTTHVGRSVQLRLSSAQTDHSLRAAATFGGAS
jgi:hypothetical protein